MAKDRRTLTGYKMIFGLLGFSAIATEAIVLANRGKFEPANFFSFFTVQTNCLVCVVLLASTLLSMRPKQPAWLGTLRSATTAYILVVGIGFAALLSGLENVALTAVPWDNVVLHYIIPCAVLIDFIVDRPTLSSPFRKNLLWLLFPIAYAAYSLIRGHITGWYPYPFLNPAPKGYLSLVFPLLGLVVLGIILVWFVTAMARKPYQDKQLVKQAAWYDSH